MTARRLSIRTAVYRAKNGFTLTGDRIRVFDCDRRVLEAMRKVYHQIDDTELRQDTMALILSRQVPPEEWEQANILASADRLDKLAAASPSAIGKSFIANAAEQMRTRHAGLVRFLYKSGHPCTRPRTLSARRSNGTSGGE